MRKRIWIAITILLALAVIVSIPIARRPKARAYFQNGEDLKAGAPVRVAGIDVGRVISVSLRPTLKQNPVEVVLALYPEYASAIPNDSIASLSTEGVLGPTFVDIDIRKTSGPPLQSGVALKTISIQPFTQREILDRISEAIQQSRHQDNQH